MRRRRARTVIIASGCCMAVVAAAFSAMLQAAQQGQVPPQPQPRRTLERATPAVNLAITAVECESRDVNYSEPLPGERAT